MDLPPFSLLSFTKHFVSSWQPWRLLHAKQYLHYLLRQAWRRQSTQSQSLTSKQHMELSWAITMRVSDCGFQVQGMLLQSELSFETVTDHGFVLVADGGILRTVSRTTVLNDVLHADLARRPDSNSRLGSNGSRYRRTVTFDLLQHLRQGAEV